MKDIITATFKDRLSAEESLRQLEIAGVTDSQVSMLISDENRSKNFNIDTHTKVDKGAAAGATFGGIVGAVMGAVMSAGVLVIPGLNLVVTGALAAGLAGLGAGAAAGGLVGGLIGLGIPEHEAKLYEEEIRKGSVLIAVDVVDGEQKKRVKSIFENNDAYNIAA